MSSKTEVDSLELMIKAVLGTEVLYTVDEVIVDGKTISIEKYRRIKKQQVKEMFDVGICVISVVGIISLLFGGCSPNSCIEYDPFDMNKCIKYETQR